MEEDVRGDRMCRELLHALESARTRLAVAVAAETKRTTPASWKQYVELENRMRRCLKRLRSGGGPGPDSNAVAAVVSSLRVFPLPSEDDRQTLSQSLCTQLHEILKHLESDPKVAEERGVRLVT